MLKNYLKIAWRNIINRKTSSLINILGLSLGITSCLAIYLITHFELTFDKFHPDAARIYRMNVERQESAGEKRLLGYVPPPAARTALAEIPGLEAAAGYQLYLATVRVPGSAHPTQKFDNKLEGISTPNTIITDPGYFAIFPREWLAGNAANALRQPYTVVLTRARAQKYFGNAPMDKIVGRELIYNDFLHVTVSGIVKDWKDNTDFPFTEFVSATTLGTGYAKDSLLTVWGNQDVSWYSRAVVKLEKGVSLARVHAQFASFLKGRVKFDYNSNCRILLQPLSDIHFNAAVDDGVRHAHLPTLYVLMGISIFILLLAVINFINLSTALSIHRAKEIGIRKVLGSSRARLMGQFLMETTILTLFAVGLAVLLVQPVLAAFHSFLPVGVAFHPSDPATVLFLLVLIAITSLLAGFYPARVLSAWLPVLSLKGAAVQKGGEKWWLRKGLIVFQFVISLIFIISTIVISRQINYMRNEDLGFSTDAILSFNTNPDDRGKKARILAEEIRHLPGVAAVAMQSFDPSHNFQVNADFQYKDKGTIREVHTSLQIGNEQFIPLYQIKLLAGSNLRHQDSLREFVINETLSRQLGFARPEDAVGHFLYADNHVIPIIGVVADFHVYSYREPIGPLALADIDGPETGVAIRLATHGRQLKNLQPLLSQMEGLWKRLYPGEPFSYSFLDDAIAQLYEKEQKTATLMNVAMSITVFISCMGLFGLSLFAARQKTKEIGIRKVLGASVANIVMLLSRDFLLLIGLALLIASPVAWYCMHRWLQDYAYRIPVSGWIFLLAGVIALSIGFITVSFQAIQAAVANPVKSLRTE